MSKVLVIRMSSFGDVAMLAPVVYSVAARYPQVRFTVMTRQAFSPLFSHLGFNVSVLPLDVRKKHKGVFGLLRMICKVKGRGYTHIADTHDVLRSKAIRWSLKGPFTKTAKIDKGRQEKAEMIDTKVTSPALKTTVERYFDVFEQLGFKAEMSFENLYDFNHRSFSCLNKVAKEKVGTWIGIAPFAQHKGKVLPLDKMERIVERLSQREKTSLFLFGAGKDEMKVINEWMAKYPNIISHHGLVNLRNELLLISYLDVMLSMDSANMHLASLVNVPVVSAWGATHPALGFYGLGQDPDNAVQVDMECRPCSVYGDKPCPYQGKDGYKCLKQISEEDIINKIEKVLAQKAQ